MSIDLLKIKKIYQVCRDGAVWRRSNAQVLLEPILDPKQNDRIGYTEDEHLMASIQWLSAAQDVTGDGGVAGRYSLKTGWSSSYPETTGYIIPTFINLARKLEKTEFFDRATQAVDFLLSTQLKCGAFPGGEISVNSTTPSVFNTAQIISGLLAYYEFSGDQKVIDAAVSACDWLVEVQNEDGSWTKGLYGDSPYTYMAHAACWVGELGKYLDNERYLNSAQLHLEWVLKFYDYESGWFDNCGFTKKDHDSRESVVHTIAYTIWGVLMLSQILSHDAGMSAATKAARSVARRLELSRYLPGRLDFSWKNKASWSCLTGNAQMALIWFELYRIDKDPTWISVACKALDLIKRTQSMKSSVPGIYGGIAGSYPIWGDYIYMKYPNWAAKYFIDALLDKKDTFDDLQIPITQNLNLRRVVTKNEFHKKEIMRRDQRIVVFTRPGSVKGKEIINAWSAWGFKPHCVFLTKQKKINFSERLRRFILNEGIVGIFNKIINLNEKNKFRKRLVNEKIKSDDLSVREFCKRLNIRVEEVESLTADSAITAVKKENPDLAIFAGGGILRKGILSVPRLGTLNAHMGILPFFRGMNVAEWSCLMGEPVGFSIHLIDEGIDTGDIIYSKNISIENVQNIDEMRGVVREQQINALGEVVLYCMNTGQLPDLYPQSKEDGKQHFSMHDSLKKCLNDFLKARANSI